MTTETPEKVADQQEAAEAAQKAEDHEAAAAVERERESEAKSRKRPAAKKAAKGDAGVDRHNNNDEWPAGKARTPEVDGSFPVITYDDPVVDG